MKLDRSCKNHIHEAQQYMNKYSARKRDNRVPLGDYTAIPVLAAHFSYVLYYVYFFNDLIKQREQQTS